MSLMGVRDAKKVRERIMNNMEEILKMALSKLKEEYGDDFKLEDGDDFIFTLNKSIVYLFKIQ